jgi:hypothetical protein
MLPWWARQQFPRIRAERYRASETRELTRSDQRPISGAESTLECLCEPASEGSQLADRTTSKNVLQSCHQWQLCDELFERVLQLRTFVGANVWMLGRLDSNNRPFDSRQSLEGQ